MNPMVSLYTIQAPGHDLAKRNKPLPIYRDPKGPYYPLAHYLGWEQWIWCLTEPGDFWENNGWMGVEYLLEHTMWILRVPAKQIVWVSMDRHCGDTQNVQKQIFSDPMEIRGENEIPMGLVKAPIKRGCVLSMSMAREVFLRVQAASSAKEAF